MMSSSLHIVPKTSQKPLQTQVITPQMIQRATVLQYSRQELLNHIHHTLSENPFLEEVGHYELPMDMTAASAEKETEDITNLFSSDLPEASLSSSSLDSHGHSHSQESLSATTVIEATLQEKSSLSRDLLTQLRFHYDISSEEYRIGEHLIDNLNKEGYLPEDKLAHVLNTLNMPLERVKAVLKTLQTFSPSGIGAKDLQECLLIQLRSLYGASSRVEVLIVTRYLKELQKKQATLIAQKTDLPLKVIKQAFKTIAMLEPKPARPYDREDTQYIIPDAYVYENNHMLEIRLNGDALPKLRYKNDYEKYPCKNNLRLKNYLQEKSQEATELLQNLRYREDNLKKVLGHLIVKQRDFFLYGLSHVKPYTMLELAGELDMNPSTLSRLANRKYIQTKWGIFSMRVFFNSSLKQGNRDVSSMLVKHVIKLLLDTHKDDKKLSDARICEYLQAKGYRIARRTVAKYRQQLNILSSHHR